MSGPDGGRDALDVEDRAALARTPAHDCALACVEAGVAAADPERAVRRHVSVDDGVLRVRGARYDLSAYDRVLVVGGGKAAGGLARALEAALGDRIAGGAVVVADAAAGEALTRVTALVGEHPTPGEGSAAGAERVLALAREAGERAAAGESVLVLAPVTGGGSALLAAPAEGVSLADLQATTDALLTSGASIDEVNAVRKHLSAVKGGLLARAAAPATVVGLVVSDVVGDDLSVVASGPLAPDPTTYADALAVLDRYGVDAPAPVREHLERGAAGDLPETPDADDPCFDAVTNHVLAGAHEALAAARDAAAERGYEPLVLTSRLRGEAREAGLAHVAVAEEALDTGDPVEPPAVVLSGGETTVTVRGDGDGGPNLELALAAALDVPEGAVLAAVDTDGRDGSTDAAGALVDADTVPDPAPARASLADNDAYAYLDGRGVLLRTGATGTNVNDLRVLVVDLRIAGE